MRECGAPGKGGALGYYRRPWHQGRASVGDSFLIKLVEE